MDGLAPEPVTTRELGQVAVLIVVVAGAHQQEPGAYRQSLAGAGPLGRDGPAGVVARPVGSDHLVAVADMFPDAILFDRLLEVVHDRRSVGDRLAVLPRLEVEAERIHVTVRANAGITEQVPGAAERLARLQDQVALAGTLVGQVPCRADAGNAGPDDQDVNALTVHTHDDGSLFPRT